MPGEHLPFRQKLHAHRQAKAGVHWRTIQKNQVQLFGERAPLIAMLISAAVALQSGRKSRAAAEMCGSCSLTVFTVIVKRSIGGPIPYHFSVRYRFAS
jgi:hypothetical protein